MAECGGLLNPPARFAQTDFHVFCLHQALLSCGRILSFAVYSSARVQQIFLPYRRNCEVHDSADAFVDGVVWSEPSHGDLRHCQPIRPRSAESLL